MFSISALYSPANWSQFFLKSILPTAFFPLSASTTSFLLQDSPILPSQWFDLKNPSCYIQDSQDLPGQLPRVVENHPKKDILELILFIKESLLEFSTGIYPKIDHLSPSDCLWLMPDHTIRCITVEDVMLLCTGSSKVLGFLKKKNEISQKIANIERSGQKCQNDQDQQPHVRYDNNTIDSSSPLHPFAIWPANTLEKESTRVQNINQKTDIFIPTLYDTPFLCLRKWFTAIHPSESYRVMVYNNRIMAISQKDGLKYDWEEGKLDVIMFNIIKFTNNTFLPNWKDYIQFTNTHSHSTSQDFSGDGYSNFVKGQHFNTESVNIVFDVYINTKNNTVRLLDVLPFPDSILSPQPEDPIDELSQYLQDGVSDCGDQGNVGSGVKHIPKPVNSSSHLLQRTLGLFQPDTILFSMPTLVDLTRVHSIEPFALGLLENNENNGITVPANHNGQNNTISTNTNNLLSFFTQTRINSTPLSVHLTQLLLNIIATKDYFNLSPSDDTTNTSRLSKNNTNSAHTNQTILHPLYSYLMPPNLPQIPSDQSVGLNFRYYFTPSAIPSDLLQIWDLFADILPQEVIGLVQKHATPELLFAPQVIKEYMFPRKTTTVATGATATKRTGPYLDSVEKVDAFKGVQDVEDNNDQSTEKKRIDDHNSNEKSPNGGNGIPTEQNGIIDYTLALPSCSSLIKSLLETQSGREIVAYALLVLQYVFLTQLSKDLALTSDFLQNQTLQKIAIIKTDIINKYHSTSGLVINHDGFVSPVDYWMAIKAAEAAKDANNNNNNNNGNTIPSIADLNPTTLIPILFTSAPSLQMNKTLDLETISVLSPALPQLALIVAKKDHSNVTNGLSTTTNINNDDSAPITLTSLTPPYTITTSSPLNPHSHSRPLFLNVFVPLPAYPIITPTEGQVQGNKKTPQKAHQATIDHIDPILSQIESTTLYPSLASSIFSSILHASQASQPMAAPIPMRIVTEYTQIQEDERVTVKQQVARLPAEDAIDVSNADGIAAFISLMTMMGEDDSDWSDEDDE